jgi:hypothetical protein
MKYPYLRFLIGIGCHGKRHEIRMQKICEQLHDMGLGA